MFGIGSTELLVILVVALIVLGPRSLASVSRSLGKAVGEFRRVSTDFQRAVNVEAAAEEAREKAARASQADRAPAAAAPPKTTLDKSDDLSIPPDSPLAQAIAKARVQADSGSGSDAGKA